MVLTLAQEVDSLQDSKRLSLLTGDQEALEIGCKAWVEVPRVGFTTSLKHQRYERCPPNRLEVVFGD